MPKNRIRNSNIPKTINNVQYIIEQEKNNLQNSDNHFRNTVKQAPIGITILHGSGFFVEMANENCLQLIDRKESEFVGRPLFETLPEIKEAVEPLLTGVLANGKPYYGSEFPLTINRYGKKELAYFNFVCQPLRNDGGDIFGVIVVANDVTQSVNAKHALAESEKQFRNLVMQSPIPMSIFKGPEFIIELANDNMFKKLWRKKKEDVLNKKLLDVFPELNQQKFPKLLRQVFTTGKPYSENETIAYIQGDDGLRKFYLDYEYAPLFDIANKPSGLFVTVNDVTEKVEARQKIQDAEERARLAISAADLGVYEIDLKANILVADKRFYEIFGYENPVSWKDIIKVLHPDDLHVRTLAHKKSRQTGLLEYEARLFKKDNKINWVRVKGKVIFSANTPVKLLGIAQDITKQKEFEATLEHKVEERTKELEEANNQLNVSNVELNQFAYIASHDLQEPLRKVRTFTELMRSSMGEIPERVGVYMDKIQTSTERMQNLINDVLKFSLLSKERQNFEEVDLNKMLHSVLNDYELLIEQKHAAINAGKLPVVEAIPLQMNQLFTNLVSNALKFSRKDELLQLNITSSIISKEELRLRNIIEDSIYFKIQFKDNGIGFGQENAEQIFTIFQRLHGKTEYEGTGIGLAMCKKIVQTHHGIIYAEAAPNAGSCFTIILPEKQHSFNHSI